MSDEEETEDEELEISKAHEFAIMIVGGIAAWVIEQQVEKLYVHVLKKRRSR